MKYGKVIINLRGIDPTFSTVDDDALAEVIDQALEEHGKPFKDINELSDYLLENYI